jgi:hypothetical protein
MGMRIGGPPRAPVVEVAAQQPAAHRSKVGASVHPFDRHWVEGSWPAVHIAHAEVSWNASRPVLRAVVHLGGLTPADVRVTARYRAEGDKAANTEPLRLWSVARLNNENVIFESGMLAHGVDDVSEFTVVVEPEKTSSHGGSLARVARQITAEKS